MCAIDLRLTNLCESDTVKRLTADILLVAGCVTLEGAHSGEAMTI